MDITQPIRPSRVSRTSAPRSADDDTTSYWYLLWSLLVLVTWWPASVFVMGGTVSTLWGWFVVPGLGLPPLGTVYASGILALIGYVKTDWNKSAESTKNQTREEQFTKLVAHVLAVLVISGLVLASGWLIKTLFL
jgi:multisubunit Na+/H+ antiporter MnhB subunit